MGRSTCSCNPLNRRRISHLHSQFLDRVKVKSDGCMGHVPNIVGLARSLSLEILFEPLTEVTLMLKPILQGVIPFLRFRVNS